MLENLDSGKRDKYNTVADLQSAFDLLYKRQLHFFFTKIDSFAHDKISYVKGSLTNLLFVFEMAQFKFSLS